MINITEKSQCSGCHACVAGCPRNCITMSSDQEGFWYPKVDVEKCIDCNLCEKVCPIQHSHTREKSDYPIAYAAINKNEDIRMKSSSGGIFTLLAESIIAHGGVVFGAAFTEDNRAVRHIAIQAKEDLAKLRGSKYLQSRIGDTYKAAKGYLKAGKPVLFTGTPCQIGGLKAYLGKEYDNLYTQDIICHGVPSPLVWRKYVEYREAKAASTTRRTFFRHKKYGWKMYSVQFEFTNCTEYIQTLKENLYMRGFLANLFLRPSCYNCSFKGVSRGADITLADFWGIQNVMPEMDDDKGTSLVLIQSEKGLRLFDGVRERMCCKEVEVEKAIQYNSAAIRSCPVPKKRTDFFKEIEHLRIDKLIEKYRYPSLVKRCKNNVKRFARKIRGCIAFLARCK